MASKIIGNRPSVLITGSSRGLGRELALEFSANGFDVIIHGRDEDELNQTAERIKEIGGNYIKVTGDLRNTRTIEELINASKNKNLSLLINNAAMDCLGLALEKFNSTQIYNSIQTNLIAPIILTSKILPLFIQKNNGTLININSLAGCESQKLRSVHSASKWGLRGFSNSLKLEAESHRINVINVFASRIKTRPEFTYGMEPSHVAKKIYNHFISKSNEDLVLDERPSKYKK